MCIRDRVKGIINDCYKRADKILRENLDKLHTMADALLKYETINADQIDDIMSGAEPRQPSDWDDNDSSKKTKSKDPTIKGPAKEV